MTESRDRHIDIARAIAIILVVLGHTGGVPGCAWLETHFPIYSYHLALFLFISGYLFREMDWKAFPAFLKKKSLRLLLPFIGWNIVYAAIVTLCNHFHLASYLPPTQQVLSFHSLFIEPFLGGHQNILNLATWFVGMLYVALLVYAFIYLLSRKLPEWSILILYACGAFAGLSIARYCTFPHWALLPLHLSYALFFLQVGRCWRIYVEPYLKRFNIWLVILIVLVIWYVVQLFGGQLYVVVWMNFEGRILIPLLTGVLGSVFWILISTIIAQYIRPNRLEQILGANTWSIMTHHLLVRFVVCYLFVRYRLDDAAMNAFQNDFWFRPAELDYWLLVCLEIGLPLLWQRFFDAVTSSARLILQKI